MKLLILCTGNSARSQMAEGRFKHFYPDWEVYSAWTQPADKVHPLAVKVMAEDWIDISKQFPKSVDKFIGQSFDVVLTVCDNAKENCPVFLWKVNHRLHHSFEDPAWFKGNKEEQLQFFRQIRDEIKEYVQNFPVLW